MELGLLLLSFLLVLGAQLLVSGTYSKYSTTENKKRLTGFDVAREILDRNGLKNITIVETKGKMTDHYDPRRKVVRLSSEVYHGTTISSVAIAAHECGHAIQHNKKYAPLMIRNTIVPVVNLASRIGYVVLVIGILASAFNVALIGIILLAATLVFQLITLPVEFNASSRAIRILEKEKLIETSEKQPVKNMLTAAALTYVASLISNMLEILRLFLINNRNRD
ncbi:MAG TPA: zinc metallopeptidase [Mollicutes bacterium]|jgi:Zn-dependent membrane protease YugP|nr:zinc metallopeptidase [Mollicutes bacterium]